MQGDDIQVRRFHPTMPPVERNELVARENHGTRRCIAARQAAGAYSLSYLTGTSSPAFG